MIISDLNYCEVVTEGLEDVAGGWHIGYKKPIFVKPVVKAKVKVKVTKTVDINKTLNFLNSNSADATFQATASGANTATSGFAITDTTNHSSMSAGGASSLTAPNY